MGLGYIKSTRHAAKDRRIISRMKRHAELMAEIEATGVARNEASTEAMRLLEEEEKYQGASR